jgi:pyruvate/2-oxoglutarate/acetoin dehydrogenase E1 component
MKDQTQMLSYAEAVASAMVEEMRRDKSVVMWGEDLTRMNLFSKAPNTLEGFGWDRVRNTPIAEVAIVEMAVGAALTGLRPIAFLGASGYFPLCLDGVFLKMGNYWQLHNYKGPVPIVVYSVIPGGRGSAADHCLSPEALLIHSPGLKVVMPSTPYDVKGLLKAAVRDDHPVIYLTHRSLMTNDERAPVPSEDYVIPIGKADVKMEGKDVTIVTYSAMVTKALTAAKELGKDGISVEVIDLRSIVPMDIETVVKSVEKTRRLLIVHEAMKRGGVAGEIAFRLIEEAPDVVRSLKAPLKRLGHKNIALPNDILLEKMIVPQTEDIVRAVKGMV